MQQRLKGHVGFVREERVVLSGKGSHKKSLFTRLDVDRSSRQQTTYVGHNWSSYAKTIERLSQTCATIIIRFVASKLGGGLDVLVTWCAEGKGCTHDAMSGDCSVIADTLNLGYVTSAGSAVIAE